MKKSVIYLIGFLFIVSFFMISCNKEGAMTNASGEKIIPFKGIMIVYTTEPNTGAQDTNYYFNYGEKILLIHNSPKKGRAVEMIIDTVYYGIYYATKEIYKKSINKDTIKKMLDFKAALEQEKGIQNLGEDEVLGKKCTVYGDSAGIFKFWIWKNILLKREMNFFNYKMEYKAIEINEKVKEDPKLFELPKNFKLYDLDNPKVLDSLQREQARIDSIRRARQALIDSLNEANVDTTKSLIEQ